MSRNTPAIRCKRGGCIIALIAGLLAGNAPMSSAEPAKAAFGVNPEVIYQTNEHRVWFAAKLYAKIQPPEDSKIASLRIIPFTELTYTDTEDSLGKVESGVQLLYEFAEYLNVSLTAQHVTTPHGTLHNEFVNNRHSETHTWETAFQIMARYPLPFTLFDKELRLIASETYVYDFRLGAGARNEMALGALLQISPHLATGLMWRHIDLVHAHDADEFVANATMDF